MKLAHLIALPLAALLACWQLPLAAQTVVPPAKPAFSEVMANRDLLTKLQKGGYVLYLRHGYTDNSRPDQFPNVDLADCNTQRLLNDEGRTLMRDVGKSLRLAKIPLGEIRVSPMCRSTWRNSSNPPSLLRSPPLKSASMTRRPNRPNSILRCAHFGIGSPRLSLASNTYDNGLSHEAADLLLMKYPG